MSEQDNLDSVKKGLLFSSEFLVPGGSNLIQGNLKQAGIHAVLGLAARAMFGVPGLIAVSANSFTKALTGRHLYEHLGVVVRPADTPAPPSTTTTTDNP